MDDLPHDLVHDLPNEVVEQIKDVLLDKIPDDDVSEHHASKQDKIPQGLLEADSTNPTYTKVLLVIGLLAVAGFVFGVIKSAVKWMIYSAILGVVAWYFFFQM